MVCSTRRLCLAVSDEIFDPKAFLNTVTSQPGVYRMYDASGTVIYVGKAKDLKKRLSSYFRLQVSSRKTETLVKNIAQIDVTVTHTETEALLLEHNYIKLYQPRYNVLLRDDKSYPLIFLSADNHPRISIHRGAKHAKGEYFGPFPNSYAVRETLALLQKLFPIRQCENSVYSNRSRPCLQYQIGRCLGPCVKGLVSEQDYKDQVDYVRLFLEGKDQQVVTQLVNRMEEASKDLRFEDAGASAIKSRPSVASLSASLYRVTVKISTLSVWHLNPAWRACTFYLFVRAKCWAAAVIIRRYRAAPNT